MARIDPTAQIERDIERKLTDMVKQERGMCLKWVCPGHSGVPDRILLLPGGRVIFAEIKRPDGGKIGRLQDWWARQLEALGFYHVFIRDEQDIRWLRGIIKEGSKWLNTK